ncbi:MAG: ribbon-helix-helix domain-containing protein [bacterium]
MVEPAKRINLSLSEEKYELLKTLAEEKGCSMAGLVEDFMDVGLELFEDIGLAEMSEKRAAEEPEQWLSLDEL